MSPRVYVLLDVMADKSDWVVRTLRSQPGVAFVDELEDPPGGGWIYSPIQGGAVQSVFSIF